MLTTRDNNKFPFPADVSDSRSRCRRAIVVFTRRATNLRKRFGLGRLGDQRLGRFLVERTVTTARSCADLADVIVADEDVQQGETFEARLLDVVERTAAAGYDRIVLIGTDTPGLSGSDLRSALLADAPVLGPSADGGFYLFGFEAARTELLRGLPWGRSSVCAALHARAPGALLLATRADLDDVFDVRAALPWLRDIADGAFLNAIEAASPDPLLEPRAPREAPISRTVAPRGPPVASGYPT